ncbi:hypothetical protein [Actinomadura harenae]|uniref:PRC-barrel domain containing protein n=1 Tax=Actinomadura harenae TaxID=2483351 RepID=A0A3M2M6F4_9ACTN|nr:hypothetical protein [Actinomadura harenae]RMI45277.1 hypothetical protein EBO15_10125 [Actinomadura harenae]
MIQMADIREWRTSAVLDSGGHKIGTLESVYVDTSTDDVLPAQDEEVVFRHYGLRYEPGAGGERRLVRR